MRRAHSLVERARDRLLGVDTTVFVYHLGADPRYGPAVAPLFDLWNRGEGRAVASVLVLTETLVGPIRSGAREAADRATVWLRGLPGLSLAEMTTDIAVRAAEIRAAHGIATPDALHAATALEHGVEAFVTNDRDFEKVADLDVILLDDFVG